MIENNLNKAEASLKFLGSLRNRFSGDREKAPDECPFSEQAVAYAFEELTPDVQQTTEAHLESCRACMDLVLDARTAVVESQQLAKTLPKVLPALSDAISQPPQASLIEKITGGTFMTLRIIAAPVAVVCFMMIISRLDVLDSVNFRVKKTATSEWSQTVKNKTAPVTAPRKKKADQAAVTAGTDPATVSSFSMHENWSIDPFEPAFRNKSRAALKKTKPSSPLEKLDLSQFKLVGVMLSDKGHKALVEDASGKGHLIREGTHIGINAGSVSRILKDRVIIEEKIEDAYGRIITQKIILKLNKP